MIIALWDGVRVPLKLQGKLLNEGYCEQLLNIHIDSPIFQQMEEGQGRILYANYTKVDINEMVDGLNIQRSSKRSFKAILKKFLLQILPNESEVLLFQLIQTSLHR